MTTIEQNARFLRRRRNRDRRNCSLEVQDITVTTDDSSVVLDGLSLELESGTKTCIVGADRSALITLLSAITGNSKVDSGSIRLNGTDVDALSAAQLDELITVVPRDPYITHGSIWDNITIGLPGVSRFQREWAADLANVDAFARFLPIGMNTVISDGSDVGAIVLSTAQTRRIALARALLRNPSILVVENPTADLTVRDEQQFLITLDNVVAGRTLLVTSSRLALARKVDEVLVLHEGRLVPYNESLTRGTVNDHSRLWQKAVNPTKATELVRCQNVRMVRPTPRVTSQSWGISVGDEIAPGYVASALIQRKEHTDIWAAWDHDREAPVKIKFPGQAPVSYHAYEQLQREYQMMRRLRHPGLAAAYEIDLEAEMPYAVFEYLDSSSLESLVTNYGRGLDPLDVLYIGFELAGAINYFHHRGRVHLNLRARHIRTRVDTIVVADFDQSRLIGSTLPASMGSGNGNRGEHHMVAPEQRPGARAHPKMDIYSLGAVMHFMAAGGVQTESTINGRRPTAFSSLMDSAPRALTTMAERMLADDPADRPDAEEILAGFERILPNSMYRPRVITLDEQPARQLAVSNN